MPNQVGHDMQENRYFKKRYGWIKNWRESSYKYSDAP
jgi:hypothetical protein